VTNKFLIVDFGNGKRYDLLVWHESIEYAARRIYKIARQQIKLAVKAFRYAASIAQSEVKRITPTVDNYEVIFGSQFFNLGMREFVSDEPKPAKGFVIYNSKSLQRNTSSNVHLAFMCRHCGDIFSEQNVNQHARAEMRRQQERGVM